MNPDADDTGLRPEIALAWHRASLSGLDHGMPVRESHISDVDSQSRLAVAAAPVLDSMLTELTDTRFSVLLADKSSRIVDRRMGRRGLDRALDQVLALPGARYLEEISGTNSLATAYELRRPISVTGEEHFLEALRVFCCYGAPIIHPVTNRLEGVLDVSGPVEDATTLLGPFLMRAVRDIQQRLLEGSRMAEKRLLAEFQAHAATRKQAVIVLGEDLVLSNSAAIDVIKSADHATLRAIAAEMGSGPAVEHLLMLSSGSPAVVRARSVAETAGGVLFEVEPTTSKPDHQRSRSHRRPRDTDRQSLQETGIVLIIGEPGTGRTTTARMLAGADAILADATGADADDAGYLSFVRAALAGKDPVIIDNVQALDARACAVITPAVRSATCPVILTSSPLTDLGAEQSALTAEALSRRELRPVRLYKYEFSALVTSVLRGLERDSKLGVTPSALEVLSTHPWPGNIRELRAVLAHAARGRTQGDITDADLPDTHRTSAGRDLSLMELAERDAIIAALRASGGNKLAAAEQLGIGRTTLYQRLRRYRISG